MKELTVNELDAQTNIYMEVESDKYIITIYESRELSHTVELKINMSNLETVNIIMAIFNYKIIRPLVIDFNKPLSEELKRLSNEDSWKPDWDDNLQEKAYFHFDKDRNMIFTRTSRTEVIIGCVYFRFPYITTIYDYLMKHKEEMIKAMRV